MTLQCWERTSAAGPARRRENIGNGGGGRRAGVSVFPLGCWGSRCPRGWKETLPYLWHKGNPGSPCLAGLGACCRTRWATGRSFGRTRSRLLFILGQTGASAKPPPLQPAHGSARLLPRALLIHWPGGAAGPAAPHRPAPLPGVLRQQGGLSG